MLIIVRPGWEQVWNFCLLRIQFELQNIPQKKNTSKICKLLSYETMDRALPPKEHVRENLNRHGEERD